MAFGGFKYLFSLIFVILIIFYFLSILVNAFCKELKVIRKNGINLDFLINFKLYLLCNKKIY